MGDITGRCLCGAVTYSAEGPVLRAGNCHCDSCRRATSSPFTSFFGVTRSGVTWQGELSEYQSSNGKVSRLFCARCGSQMTYQYTGWPEETHLYAATLDDPANFKAEAHFHYAERLPWVVIDDDLPKYPGSADTTAPL